MDGAAPDDATALLDALQDAVLPQLQSLLVAAAAEVCPSVAHVLNVPRDAVRRAPASGGADVSCHAPVSAWRRLNANAAPADEQRDGECGVFALRRDAAEPRGGVRVVTRSAFGVLRSRDYASVGELAEAWLAAMPSRDLGALCADVRALPKGVLAFTSRAAMASQRAEGRLLCAACGRFFAGRRGLRDHSQVAHGQPYDESVAAVAAARRAMVLVSARHAGQDADPLADTELHEALAARARVAAAARSALHEGLVAARDGDVAALRAALAAGWDARTCSDRHGSTAIHFAAGGGHLEACRLLVQDAHVDVATAQRTDGRTAMHWAARNGHVAVCKWLMSVGADPDAATRDGTTAFHWAAWQGQIAVMEWLADDARVDWRSLNAYGCNAGQWAAMSGNLATCEWLHARGLDWGLLNANGHSCLHKAAQKGQVSACTWLLQVPRLGAPHMQPDKDGNTPARMAAADGHAQLAQTLRLVEEELTGATAR